MQPQITHPEHNNTPRASNPQVEDSAAAYMYQVSTFEKIIAAQNYIIADLSDNEQWLICRQLLEHLLTMTSKYDKRVKWMFPSLSAQSRRNASHGKYGDLLGSCTFAFMHPGKKVKTWVDHMAILKKISPVTMTENLFARGQYACDPKFVFGKARVNNDPAANECFPAHAVNLIKNQQPDYFPVTLRLSGETFHWVKTACLQLQDESVVGAIVIYQQYEGNKQICISAKFVSGQL